MEPVTNLRTRDVGAGKVEQQDEAVHATSKALYKTLNPDGRKELDLEELLQNVSKARGNANDTESLKRKALVESTIKKLLRRKGGNAFDEDDLKNVNMRFQSGKLPKLKNMPDIESVEDNHEETSNEAKKGVTRIMLKYAVSSTAYIWKYAEKAVSRTGRTWMWTLLPTGQISTLLSFLLFSYVIRESFLTWFIPLALLTAAIVLMVVSTVRLVRGKKRFMEFEAWGEFLDLISTNEKKSIDTGKAEEAYVLKHVSPYIHFILASICCVMGFGTSNKSWVLTSELAVLSLLMYGVVVWVFNFYAVGNIRNILFCQILSTAVRGFQCNDASQMFGVLALPIPFVDAKLIVSLSSVFRMVMLLQLVRLATSKAGNTKFNAYIIRHVLPVIIAMIWWDVGNLFICQSTMFSIARASVECATVIFALPLVAVMMAYALLSAVLSIDPTRMIIMALVISVIVAYISFRGRGGMLVKQVTAFLEKSSLKRVAFLAAFICLGYIMLYYRPAGLKVKDSGLSWENYRDLCVTPTPHAVGNSIVTATACHEFRGYGVTWEGDIDDIGVTEIKNKVDELLSVLPQSIASWLSCRYGVRYPTDEVCSNKDRLSPFDISRCNLSKFTARSCSIQNHNIYTFEVKMSMPMIDGSSTTVALAVPNEFTNMLLELRKGMQIKFSGILTGNKGALSVRALYINSDTDNTVIKAENRVLGITSTLDVMIDEAFSALYSFLFYPIITLK